MKGSAAFTEAFLDKQGVQAAHAQKTQNPRRLSGKGFQCEGECGGAHDQLLLSSLADVEGDVSESQSSTF